AIRQLFGSTAARGGQPEPELSGAGFTYRHDWGARRGQWVLRLDWNLIQPPSRVLVAIGEGVPGGPSAGKFIGAARYTCTTWPRVGKASTSGSTSRGAATSRSTPIT